MGMRKALLACLLVAVALTAAGCTINLDSSVAKVWEDTAVALNHVVKALEIGQWLQIIGYVILILLLWKVLAPLARGMESSARSMENLMTNHLPHILGVLAGKKKTDSADSEEDERTEG